MESSEQDRFEEESRDAQRDLEKALDEACDTDPASDVDTGALIRLDELLSEASDAAKRAISLRRRQRADRDARETTRVAMTKVEAEVGDEATHRILRDASGVRWDVFAVHPTPEVVDRVQLRGSYSQGWLCFDSGSEKRRLSPIPDDWFRMTNDQLMALAEHAEVAKGRQ
jgi:hypothetical protein